MLETLPIFPLPDTVLFPRTLIRLHVFEPRYLAMMEAVMAGDQHMGLAHLKPGYEKDYFGKPPVYKVCTAARVMLADQEKNGRWNILLEGAYRARIVEELASDPFRVVRVRPLVEQFPTDKHGETMRLMEGAARRAEALAEHFENGQRALINLVNQHQHPSIVADVISSVIVADPYTRQSLLEEVDPHRRLRLLLIHLDEVIGQLKDQGVQVNLPMTEAE